MLREGNVCVQSKLGKTLSVIAFVSGVLCVFSCRKWADLCQRYRLHQPAAAVIQVTRAAT